MLYKSAHAQVRAAILIRFTRFGTPNTVAMTISKFGEAFGGNTNCTHLYYKAIKYTIPDVKRIAHFMAI